MFKGFHSENYPVGADTNTVESPKRGQIGTRGFVLYREVVLSKRLYQNAIFYAQKSYCRVAIVIIRCQ